MTDVSNELRELLLRATPTAMGGTPDLNYPDCPHHGFQCPDPWDCYERDVRAYLDPEWDGVFTPEQEALHQEVESNTERLLAALDAPESGPCGDPECHVLHADPANPIHPPWYVDSRP